MCIVIYLITNTYNGKHYVGQSVRGAHKRWRKHVSDSKYRECPIHLAIVKYGEESFTLETLWIARSQEEANTQECHFITQYSASVNEHGYNVAEGGSKGNIFVGFSQVRMDEYRAKMSVVKKGISPSSETRAKIAAAQTGSKHHLYGKHHTIETRTKMSNAHTGARNPQYGKAMSAETKAKIGESQKKRWEKIKR